MRRNWRGRYKNNWNRNNNKSKTSTDNRSLNNSTSTIPLSATACSVRAPANQVPIVIPINSGSNTWKLYFPTEGLLIMIYCNFFFSQLKW